MNYDDAMKLLIEFTRDSIEDLESRTDEAREYGQLEAANANEETIDEVSKALEVVEEEFYGVSGYTADGTPII